MRHLPFFVATIAFALTVCAASPSQPKTPKRVDSIVLAQQFTLTKSYEFYWREEKPNVEKGWILVLKVDPELVRPKQTLEPVLYVGDQTAERVNIGFKSGYVVAIVPSVVDLSESRIWFGDPDLPEKVNAEKIKKAREAAIKANIQPFSEELIATAKKEAAKKLTAIKRDKNNAATFRDRDALRRSLAPLIRAYAPDEKTLLEQLETIPQTPDDT